MSETKNSVKIFVRNNKLIFSKILVLIFVISLVGDFENNFYNNIKILVAIFGIFVAYESIKSKHIYEGILYCLITLIYNPLAPFKFEEDTWKTISVFSALCILVELSLPKIKQVVLKMPKIYKKINWKKAVTTILILFVVILSVILVSTLTPSKSKKSYIQNNNEQESSTKVLLPEYPDTLVFRRGTVTESSSWLSPSQKISLTTVNIEGLSKKSKYIDIATGQAKKDAEIAKKWEEYPLLLKKLQEMGLDNDLYRYYYSNLSIPEEILKADVTGDNKDDRLLISIGIGCVSCHAKRVVIYSEGYVYEAGTNKGYVMPSVDQKGLYIFDVVNEPDKDTEGILVSRYTWNRGSFSIEAEKSVVLKH